MFDHVEFSVRDLAAARRFYGGIVTAIGGAEAFSDADELGLSRDGIVALLLTRGTRVPPPMHICFQAPDKAAVDASYTAALAAGGVCNGKPGYRPDYGDGYYAAFIRDADGHNIEVLFREGR